MFKYQSTLINIELNGYSVNRLLWFRGQMLFECFKCEERKYKLNKMFAIVFEPFFIIEVFSDHSLTLFHFQTIFIKTDDSPKIATQTEATDTSDLILQFDRGVNTDASSPKKSRLTNTERISTEEKSTNTIFEGKITVNAGTNTDLSEISIDGGKFETSEKTSESESLNEHKCHNCVAKIEIKQRTIIKKPNAAKNVGTSVTKKAMTKNTSAETITEIHNEELTSSTQSPDIDIQSRIPRPTVPMSPLSERKFTRQNTYTIPPSPTLSPLPSHQMITSDLPCPVELYLS